MTEPLAEQLKQIRKAALAELATLSYAEELKSWHIKFLGRKGLLPQALRLLKNLPVEDKRIAGSLGNEMSQHLESLYEARLKELKPGSEARQKTKPLHSHQPLLAGALNPLTLAIRDIYRIFTSLGFTLAEGPLLEEPQFNFDLLNIPLEHPARAETDTFYLQNGRYVLRTHTSPVQLRAVLENNLHPPFQVFSPGRVFRAEKIDASHQHTFYQVEALMVGEDVTVAHFKGVVAHFYSEFFNQPVQIRLRPSYFPFVEPGFEVDISCPFCAQKGCRLCQITGWLEVMGAGMVHPNVLANMNLDSNRFQGFAFGGGIDRLAMLRHGISDIRLLLGNDLRFIRQFK